MQTDPSSTQAQRMRAAIDRAVAVAPGFLRGEVDAQAMTDTMISSVRDYVAAERADGRDGTPHDPDGRALYPVLAELAGCGSGYQAGRCDADCVARTMAQLVREFGTS